MFFRKRSSVLLPSARTVRTCGLSEDSVRENIRGLAGQFDILSHPKGVDIRVSVETESREASAVLLEAAEKKLRERLGNSVYGIDGEKMEEALARALSEAGMTLAVAESCTGGLICHWITNVPGSSKYFKQGFIVYSDSAKTGQLGVRAETIRKFGAVSSRAVEEMAKQARRIAGTDAAIAVSGISGPGGGTGEKPPGTVYICVIAGEKTQTEKYLFKGWRELVKIQAAQTALDMLRKKLQ